MVILAVIIVLLILLLASAWSSARSYFAKGRLAGMEEATLEIIRGISSHYESAGQAPPDYVTKAVEAVKSFARGACYEKSILRYQARLWVFGDAVGAACWRRGYDTCKLQMTPADDQVRVALSIGELLHLASLAHLGFKKMMPTIAASRCIASAVRNTRSRERMPSRDWKWPFRKSTGLSTIPPIVRH
jgi:hypothetical protein